jgi:hypothetical protein
MQKRRGVPLWARVIALLLGLWFLWVLGTAILGGGSSTPRLNNAPIAPAAPRTNVVIYNVDGLDGAARASLTYTNEQGGTQQEDNVALPWRKALSVPRGQFVYVSAQNQDGYGGVSCDIRVDTQLFKHSESRGAYVIASCSGLTP